MEISRRAATTLIVKPAITSSKDISVSTKNVEVPAPFTKTNSNYRYKIW